MTFHAIAPITVHVTGDNTAMWTVIGTLAGAIIGALVTWLLQRDKIAADRAHVELESLRHVLDEGAEALNAGRVVNALLVSSWSDSPDAPAGEENLPSEPPSRDSPDSSSDEENGPDTAGRRDRAEVAKLVSEPPSRERLQAEQRQAVQLALGAASRLGLRLPDESPTLKTYTGAANSFVDASNELTRLETYDEYSNDEAEIDRLIQKSDDDYKLFMRQAQRAYGPSVRPKPGYEELAQVDAGAAKSSGSVT
jgi:hypothetical protein